MSVIPRRLVVFHPSPFMVGAVDDLVAELAPPDLVTDNIVVPDLLSRAERGMTENIRKEVLSIIAKVDGSGSPVILCTCSTLGGCAEEAGVLAGRSVVRIDRPMAERAVALGSTIGVVAAVQSTVEPTCQLLKEVAAAAQRDVNLKKIIVESAWEKKRAGDTDGYIHEVVKAIRSQANCVDVIVLAQGSMASAADQLSDITTPILSSPRLGVARAIEMAMESVVS